jgi:hypothetical protein
MQPINMEGKLDMIIKDMSFLKEEVKKINKIDSLEVKFDNLDGMLNILAGKIDEIQILSNNVKKLETVVTDTQNTLAAASSEIHQLKQDVELLHRARASRQIVIENVPVCQNENAEILSKIISKVLEVIGCPNTIFAIDAHRLGKPNDQRSRPPPILAEFSNTYTRDTIMKFWRSKKFIFSDEICPYNSNFGLEPNDRQNIYINKNFSPNIRQLLFEARKLKKHGYKIIYEYANNVYAKRTETDEAVKIVNVQFVKEIIEHVSNKPSN